MEIDAINKALDAKRRLGKGRDGREIEYWTAREIQPILGYEQWRTFEQVIDRAKMACESAGIDPKNHFAETSKKVVIGSGALAPRADCYLTRYGCYLVAMNGETPEVGVAQTYFAAQTRRQELQDQLTDGERRLLLRERVRRANKELGGAAKRAGVKRFGLFQDEGYRGLYDMRLAEIRAVKGLLPDDDLLDHAGRTELAANEFRITQATDKLARESVRGEHAAMQCHFDVAREVRDTIGRIGGTMPESLPAEPNIKKLVRAKRQALRKGMKSLPDSTNG